MRGEKTIDLGFMVDVSVGGEYVPADNVTVRAPGLGKFDVHTTMQAYVSQAVLNFSKMRGEMTAAMESDDDDDAAPAATGDDEQDVMMIMAMGLKSEYPAFAAYVKKVLTNSKLASVGDSKLTDEAWIAIEEAGGTEAALRVMSEFTGFFFDALGSKRKTGSDKSPTSSSRTKAGSNTKKREATPG